MNMIAGSVVEVEQIWVVARSVRRALESLNADPRRRFWAIPSMAGACDFSSSSIVRLLRKDGISSRLAVGTWDESPHCWAVAEPDGESFFVDVTASQFGLPDVHVLRPDSDPSYRALFEGRHAEVETVSWHSSVHARESLVKLLCRRAMKFRSSK